MIMSCPQQLTSLCFCWPTCFSFNRCKTSSTSISSPITSTTRTNSSSVFSPSSLAPANPSFNLSDEYGFNFFSCFALRRSRTAVPLPAGSTPHDDMTNEPVDNNPCPTFPRLPSDPYRRKALDGPILNRRSREKQPLQWGIRVMAAHALCLARVRQFFQQVNKNSSRCSAEIATI